MSMSRRGAMLALPALAIAARAQPLRAPAKRIGLLVAGSERDMQSLSREMGSRLSALGWQPGAVVIEGSYADGPLNRLPELAGELVRRPVDLIVTPGRSRR